VVAAATRGGVV